MHPDKAFSAGPKRAANGETILLVDDDLALLSLTRDFLAGEGYHVLDAPGGVEALKIAEKYLGPIHLLLTDLVMPRLNGLMLAKQLRPIRPETKVMLMSAYTSELVDLSKVLGAPQIAKPFHLSDLAHKVREILGYRSPFARRHAQERQHTHAETSEGKRLHMPRSAAQ